MAHCFMVLCLIVLLNLLIIENVLSSSIPWATKKEVVGLSNDEFLPDTKEMNEALKEEEKTEDLVQDKRSRSPGALIEGDIKLNRRFSEIRKNKSTVAHHRKDVILRDYLWGKEIPYTFSDRASSLVRHVIQSAIKDFEDFTCLRFVKRKEEKDYILFQNDNTGCWSYVGKIGDMQEVNIGPECLFKGTALHEMMHALGFIHEHTRFDRNKYIKIKYENIKFWKYRNFKRYGLDLTDDYQIQYDFDSIMHYGAKAFSKNGRVTIKPRNKKISLKRLGQRLGLSKLDIKQINKVYDCPVNDKRTKAKNRKEGNKKDIVRKKGKIKNLHKITKNCNLCQAPIQVANVDTPAITQNGCGVTCTSGCSCGGKTNLVNEEQNELPSPSTNECCSQSCCPQSAAPPTTSIPPSAPETSTSIPLTEAPFTPRTPSSPTSTSISPTEAPFTAKTSSSLTSTSISPTEESFTSRTSSSITSTSISPTEESFTSKSSSSLTSTSKPTSFTSPTAPITIAPETTVFDQLPSQAAKEKPTSSSNCSNESICPNTEPSVQEECPEFQDYPCWPGSYSANDCKCQDSPDCGCNCIQMKDRDSNAYLCYKKAINQPQFKFSLDGKIDDMRCTPVLCNENNREQEECKNYLCHSNDAPYNFIWKTNENDELSEIDKLSCINIKGIQNDDGYLCDNSSKVNTIED